MEAIQPWTRNPEWACQRPLCLLEELLIVVAIKKRAKCLDSAQVILDSSRSGSPSLVGGGLPVDALAGPLERIRGRQKTRRSKSGPCPF